MDTLTIHISDWQRILIGETPWIFLAEVVVRSVIIYLMIVFFMRLMGKRVAAQLSMSELAVVLTLGAAAGLPMQVPERGILPAAAVLAVALVFQRGLSLI